MRQSGDTFHAGVYLNGKHRLADEKRDKLLDIINRLTQLSYEKGTRSGDTAVRNKLKDVVGEIERYYRMVRAFASGKGGDTYAYQEILGFFNERYLEKFELTALLNDLRQEIDSQDRRDLERNADHAARGHARKTNTYARKLEEELKAWEKMLLYTAEPLLRTFLSDVNDIYFYHRINARIGELITKDNTFITSGEAFLNFKASIGYFLDLNIKINRKPLADKDIVDLITQMLQQMGLRNAIMHTRTITLEKFNEIAGSIIIEWNLRELTKQYSGTTRGAIDAIRTFEKDSAKAIDARDMMKILEDLCYLGDPLEKPIPHPVVSNPGLARAEKDRFLFHSPGTFNISLKFISEYARNSLILVVDFLYKELQKGQSSFKLLAPMMEFIPSVQEFVKLYAMALDVSDDKSNQTSDRKGTQQYITRQMARDLIESIRDITAEVRGALVDTTYKIGQSSLDKTGVLAKKISILQEAWNETHAKISKGLSDMARA